MLIPRKFQLYSTSLFPPFFPAPVVVDGDPTKPKKTSKGKKKTKKSEPADLSMFDENAPSIFDDSLSALGQ